MQMVMRDPGFFDHFPSMLPPRYPWRRFRHEAKDGMTFAFGALSGCIVSIVCRWCRWRSTIG
jgi:hypothetical protein